MLKNNMKFFYNVESKIKILLILLKDNYLVYKVSLIMKNKKMKFCKINWKKIKMI